MNKRRLLKMADFVETIPRKEFDMADFGDTTRCGFVGCAMGWAAHDRIFRGLKLVRDDFGFGFVPQYEGLKTWWAAYTLFDISLGDALGLFSDTRGNRTPKQVAKNIRRYVETGELP